MRICKMFGNGKRFQTFAPLKRVIPDELNTIRDRDAREGFAVGKRAIPDAGNTVRDRDFREGGAA